MHCEIHMPEFGPELFDQIQSLFVTVLFMFLHCQKDQITFSCSGVLGKNPQSVRKNLDVLLVRWYCECMVHLVVVLSERIECPFVCA